MAIIQSILVGKGKGKVGNVVLTTLKGQTIAKALNSSPANPKTALQVASRNRMSNAVMAYKFLAGFLVFWLGVAKQTESLYNAFISATKNLFSDTKATSISVAAGELGASNLVGSAAYSLTGCVFDGTGLIVNIATSGLAKPADLHVRTIGFDKAFGSVVIRDRAVTEPEWAIGELTVFDAVVGSTNAGAYLYSASDKKATNIVFNEA